MTLHESAGVGPAAGAGPNLAREPDPPATSDVGPADAGSSSRADGAPRPEPRREPGPEPDADRGELSRDTSASRSGRGASPPRAPGVGPFVAAGLVLAGLVGYGAWGHYQQRQEAEATQRKVREFVPEVRTVRAQRDDGPIEVTLPGATQAYATASIYARATGYVAEWKADIGTRVRQGDLLMRIAAPDLDQQLAQAEAQIGQIQAQVTQAQAQVDQARASQNLANVTNSRTTTLATQGWETKQNADTSKAGVLTSGANLAAAEAGVKVAEANLKAQGATVDRLKALTAFEKVVAPFDGVVTSRSVEVGNLVSADAGGGTPLFSMDRDDVLRVTTNVPQNLAAGMREGVPAKIRVPDLPGRTFEGRVTRSSVSLLTSARALTVQIDVPNPDGTLRPGQFADVQLAVPRARAGVTVPAEALVFDQRGTHVALLRDDDTAAMRPVTIDRDLGTTVSLREGLSGDETVVLSPPAGLRDGDRIKPARNDKDDKGGKPGGGDGGPSASRPDAPTRHEASRSEATR